MPPLSLSLPLFAQLVPMVPSPQSARIPNLVAPSVCVSPIPLICAAQPLPAVPMAVPAESFPWSCKPPPRPPPFPIPRSFLQPPAADPGTYTSPPYTLRPSRRPSHAGHRGPEFPHRRRRTPLFTPPGVPFVLLPHEGETESDKGEAPGPGHGPRPRFPSPSPSPSPAFGLARRFLPPWNPPSPPSPIDPSTAVTQAQPEGRTLDDAARVCL